MPANSRLIPKRHDESRECAGNLFKLRGAYFKISTLTEEEKAKGVVACSAGNHAQGVALAASRAGTKAVIFLSAGAPISKVEATKGYGAEVRLIDGVYDDAYAAAVAYQKETGAVFIHPFSRSIRSSSARLSSASKLIWIV